MKIFQDDAFGEIFPESEKVPFRVRSAGHFSIDAAHRSKTRVCNFVELFWCIRGSGCFRYPEGIFTLHPGEVCFYNTGCLHDYTPSSAAFEYCWVSFEGPQAETFFQGFRTSRLPRFAGTCPEELFAKLRSLLIERDPRNVYSALALGVRIMTAALTPSPDEIDRHPDYAAIARRLVDENFSNPDTTVNFLAEQLHLHRVSLSRLFHAKTGISLSGYIQKKRMDQAEKLLRTTEHTIRDIALMCGFLDYSYFLRAFSKRTGISPGRFRAACRDSDD